MTEEENSQFDVAPGDSDGLGVEPEAFMQPWERRHS